MTLVEAWRVAFVRDVEVSREQLQAAQVRLYEAARELAPRALARLTRGVGFEELRDDVVNAWFVHRMGNALPAERRPLTEDHVRASLVRSLYNAGVVVLRRTAKAQGRPVKKKHGSIDEPPATLSAPITPTSDAVPRDAGGDRLDRQTQRKSVEAWDDRGARDVHGPRGARSTDDDIALAGRFRASQVALGFEGVGSIMVRDARSNALKNATSAHAEHGELLRAHTTLEAIYALEDADTPTQAKDRVNQRHRRFRVGVEKRRGDARAEGVIEDWQHDALPAFIVWMASADGLARWAARGEPIILPEHDADATR